MIPRKATPASPTVKAKAVAKRPAPAGKPASKSPVTHKLTATKSAAPITRKTPKAANTAKTPQAKQTAPAPSIDKAALKLQEKVKKPKLVRDSFTIPKAEYAAIEALKLRAGQLSTSAKKSEILRAGIKALSAMSDTALLAALAAVPALKTGRPSTAKD